MKIRGELEEKKSKRVELIEQNLYKISVYLRKEKKRIRG